MDDAIQKINDLVTKIENGLQTLTNKVNSILSHVPWGLGWLADRFRDAWNWAMGKVQAFWDKVGEFLSYLGQPWALNDAKKKWIELGGPVAARAATADKSQSTVDYDWSGKAADAYAGSLPAQQTALKDVQGKLTSPIGPALGSLASALYIFYGAVVVALGIMALAMVTATGEAVSILGLPAVPPTVLTAALAAIGAIAAATLNLNNAASNTNTTLLQVVNEQGSFGPSNWPKAVLHT